jgi:integrase
MLGIGAAMLVGGWGMTRYASLQTAHDLRRTYATWMRDANPPVPLDIIQRLLGHSDISTTIRFYLGDNRQSDDLVRAALAGNRPKQDLMATATGVEGGSTSEKSAVTLSKTA